ncbi:MAG: 3-dehydroquinate synthase [Planctomycetota bacterium]|nr:3-dehydroquinate synthase [Planctomycetota bacterium]
MISVPVEVGRSEHRYNILVGEFLPDRWPGAIEAGAESDKYFAVLDSRADRAHRLRESLAGREGWRFLVLEAGEGRKGVRDYASLCENLIREGVDRRSVLAAVGGGVIGDLAGFAAATILRGIRLAQVPTTLLAQVDSSVGGKTGVNLAGGKNLLGAFHQPEMVLIDPGFLASLPEREYRAGLAEVVKYGIIADRAFFDRLAGSADLLRRRDPAFLGEISAYCCRAKAALVMADELDSGRRAILNHGHTFGHALEALAGYDGSLLHGEAVGLGMAMAAEFAAARGLAGRDEAELTRAVLRRLGIPAGLAEAPPPAGRKGDWRDGLTAEALAGALSKDKKAGSAGLTLVLPRRIGDCRLESGFAPAEVAGFMMRAIG